jgi:hypothetical protein
LAKNPGLEGLGRRVGQTRAGPAGKVSNNLERGIMGRKGPEGDYLVEVFLRAGPSIFIDVKSTKKEAN